MLSLNETLSQQTPKSSLQQKKEVFTYSMTFTLARIMGTKTELKRSISAKCFTGVPVIPVQDVYTVGCPKSLHPIGSYLFKHSHYN